MNKIYFIPVIFLFALPAFGQYGEGKPSGLRMISKGDSFSVRSTNVHFEKKALLSNLLRIAGAGALAYQSDRIIRKDNIKTGQSVIRNNWLAPVGAGLMVFSSDIAGRKKSVKQYIRYILYNKDTVPIQGGLLAVTRRSVLKNGGILLHQEAPENGFIKVEAGGGNDSEIRNPGFVLEVTPGPNRVYRASPVARSPEPAIPPVDMTSLLPNGFIPPGEKSRPIPERGMTNGKAEVRTGGLVKPEVRENDLVKTLKKEIPVNTVKVSVISAGRNPDLKSSPFANSAKAPEKEQSPAVLPFLMRTDLIKNDQSFKVVDEQGESAPDGDEKEDGIDNDFFVSVSKMALELIHGMTPDFGYDDEDGAEDDDDGEDDDAEDDAEDDGSEDGGEGEEGDGGADDAADDDGEEDDDDDDDGNSDDNGDDTLMYDDTDDDNLPCDSSHVSGTTLSSFASTTFSDCSISTTSTIVYSTATPPGYSLVNGMFVNNTTGQSGIGGVTLAATSYNAATGQYSVSGDITIYVAPRAIQQGTATLQQVIGHELIHASNIDSYTNMYANPATNAQWDANSEYAAYTYQANIAYNNEGDDAATAYAFYSGRATTYGSGKNATWSTGAGVPDAPTAECLT